MACGQSIVFLLVFYIIAFIYVKEPHFKYFGYIMLTIVYIFSLGIALQNSSAIVSGFQPFKNAFLTNTLVRNIFILLAFSIIVFNLYSLGRILEAYWFKTKSMKSFDLKLNKRHKKNLRNFDMSFIVGNVASALLLLSFVGFGDTGIQIIEEIKMAVANGPIVFIQAFLFMVSFASVWVETTYSTMFSYIKRD
jgi:hypothetical protein